MSCPVTGDSDLGTSQWRWGRMASSVLSGNHSAGVLSGSFISRIRVTRIFPIFQLSTDIAQIASVPGLDGAPRTVVRQPRTRQAVHALAEVDRRRRPED